MFGSAQNAPVTSAALTALNLAVVRQVVFKHAAAQISERRDDATETVVQTAEENRNRNEVVGDVIESKMTDNFSNNDPSKFGKPENEFKSPDFSSGSGKTLDISV
tara:strand:- start:504 stop:818 length:315 start_codon:yes stop_codon:yes gene_type:complete